MKWHQCDEMPKKMRPFLQLHSDGSGAMLCIVLADGRTMVEDDGTVYGYLDDSPMNGAWCYLPPGHQFWGLAEYERVLREEETK